MYFASVDFSRRSLLRRAVQQGVAITLFNPAINLPAINGEVTVVGPWKLLGKEDVAFKNAGWQARCKVQDMRVTEVTIEQRERRNARRTKAMD